MVTIDLDALEAAEKAATPGQWTGFRTGILRGPTWVVSNDPDRAGCIMSAADAAFIAAARNAMPGLIAELRRALDQEQHWKKAAIDIADAAAAERKQR